MGRAAALLTAFETNLRHHVDSHYFVQDCQVDFLLILQGQDMILVTLNCFFFTQDNPAMRALGMTSQVKSLHNSHQMTPANQHVQQKPSDPHFTTIKFRHLPSSLVLRVIPPDPCITLQHVHLLYSSTLLSKARFLPDESKGNWGNTEKDHDSVHQPSGLSETSSL